MLQSYIREKKESIVRKISKKIHNRKGMRRSNKFFESVRNKDRSYEIVESERKKTRRKALFPFSSKFLLSFSLSLSLSLFLFLSLIGQRRFEHEDDRMIRCARCDAILFTVTDWFIAGRRNSI